MGTAVSALTFDGEMEDDREMEGQAVTACEQCGSLLEPGDRFCSACGVGLDAAPAASATLRSVPRSPAPPPVVRREPRMAPQVQLSELPPPPASPHPGPPVYDAPAGGGTNGFSIAALVLGIVWLWGLGSLLALIFGIMAKNQIDASGGRQGGRGMAIAGIVLGIVGLAGVIVFIILIAAAASSTPSYTY